MRSTPTTPNSPREILLGEVALYGPIQSEMASKSKVRQTVPRASAMSSSPGSGSSDPSGQRDRPVGGSVGREGRGRQLGRPGEALEIEGDHGRWSAGGDEVRRATTVRAVLSCLSRHVDYRHAGSSLEASAAPR